MFFMPESPYYLITKNNEAQALKSLQWLRGSDNVKDEIEDMKRAYRDQQLIGNVSYGELFKDGVYLRPFLIVMALMFFQQFSGINAVLFYLKVGLIIYSLCKKCGYQKHIHVLFGLFSGYFGAILVRVKSW